MTAFFRIALALCTLVASSAFAQPSVQAEAARQAKALHVEGVRLRDAGDLPTALTKFKSAYALTKTPITGLSVGTTLEKMGRLVEARAVLVETAAMPDYPGITPTAIRARAEAGELGVQLKARIPTVHVRITGPADGVDAAVDGESLPADKLVDPIALDPGRHVVRIRRGTVVREQEVSLKEGDNPQATFDLTPPPVAARVHPQKQIVEPPPAQSRPTPVLATVGFALAVGGVMLGSIGGAIVLVNKSSLDNRCPAGACPPDSFGILRETNTWATVSTVSFIIAGVGLALGVAALIVRPSEPKRTAWLATPTAIGGAF